MLMQAISEGTHNPSFLASFGTLLAGVSEVLLAVGAGLGFLIRYRKNKNKDRDKILKETSARLEKAFQERVDQYEHTIQQMRDQYEDTIKGMREEHAAQIQRYEQTLRNLNNFNNRLIKQITKMNEEQA